MRSGARACGPPALPRRAGDRRAGRRCGHGRRARRPEPGCRTPGADADRCRCRADDGPVGGSGLRAAPAEWAVSRRPHRVHRRDVTSAVRERYGGAAGYWFSSLLRSTKTAPASPRDLDGQPGLACAAQARSASSTGGRAGRGHAGEVVPAADERADRRGRRR